MDEALTMVSGQHKVEIKLEWNAITNTMTIRENGSSAIVQFYASAGVLRELSSQFDEWADTLEQFEDDQREEHEERINPYGLDTDDNWRGEL